MAVDPHAARGFGSGADEYDRYRPGWPPEAIDRILLELGLGSDAVVVDLAAGTGKLTRLLVPRANRVIAVEPSGDMRRRLAEVVPEAEVLDGAADSIPLDDGAVDALCVAEAFHWFATPEAGREIARVVRPGGGVAILWNAHGFGDEPWLASVGGVIGEALAPAFESANRHRPERWQDAFEGGPFEPFEHFEVPHEQRTDVDGFVGHVSTWSHTRVLDSDVREKLLSEVREVLQSEHPTPEEVVIPYRATVYWARRKPD